MLDSMRGVAKSFVSKALMIFLVITFAVWGAGDVVRGGSSYALKVGDEKITPNQVVSEQRTMERAMQQMGFPNANPQYLTDSVIAQLVKQKLVKQWQQDTGLFVDRGTLSRNIARSEQFRGPDGKFDPELFSFYLQQRQMSEGMYLAQLGEEVSFNAMVSSVDTRDVAIPESLRELQHAVGTQARDVVLLTVAPASMSPASVTEAEAKDYYEQNKTSFAQPERRTIEYIVLDSASLKAEADKAVTDESSAAEQREMAIQDIAMSIEDALAGGSTMREAVAEAGVKAQSNTLTDVTADAEGDALKKAVLQYGFDLSEGESSSLQSTDDGRYFMVSVTKVKPAAPKAFTEVSGEVRTAVAKTKAREETRERVAKVKAALLDGTSWQEAARAVNAQTRTVSGLVRPANEAVKEVNGVPAALQMAVFEHKVGGVAGPLARPDGGQQLALVTQVRTMPAKKTVNDGDKEMLAADFGSAVETSVYQSLTQRYPVTVNQAVVQQLRGETNE